MVIHAHYHVESALDVGHQPNHIQQGAVWMLASHRQAICLCKSDDRLIILFGRSKHLCELFRAEIVTEIAACWIVNLPKQVRERLLIAQREPDCQTQTRPGWKSPYREQ